MQTRVKWNEFDHDVKELEQELLFSRGAMTTLFWNVAPLITSLRFPTDFILGRESVRGEDEKKSDC